MAKIRLEEREVKKVPQIAACLIVSNGRSEYRTLLTREEVEDALACLQAMVDMWQMAEDAKNLGF